MNNITFYEALDEVLATSRYDRLTGRRVDLQERFNEWLEEALYNFFSNINWEAMPGQVGYNLNIIATVFMVIGAILIGVTGVILFRAYKGRRHVVSHDLSDIFEALARKEYTVAELMDLSDNAADMRVAIRYRYIAALVCLNEKQVIIIKPSATNGIIAQQVKNTAPAIFPAFEYAADVFQRAWFGYKSIDNDAYQHFTHSINTLIAYVE